MDYRTENPEHVGPKHELGDLRMQGDSLFMYVDGDWLEIGVVPEAIRKPSDEIVRACARERARISK